MHMNTQSHPVPHQPAGFAGRRLNSRAALQHLGQLKASVLEQFKAQLPGHQELLQAAVSEAEALAWQTAYPHLLFPVLAEEKAAAVSRWAEHQASVRQATESFAFAA